MITRHDNELLTNSCANFGLTNSERRAPYAHNIRLKEIKKRRALIDKQRVELLMNSAGKRTVVLLNPSFLNFVNPFFVSGSLNAPIEQYRKFVAKCNNF